MSAPALPPDLFAIEAEGLVLTSPAGGCALDGVTFGVVVGAAFALLGGPRSGASAVMEVLGGVRRADAGRAWVAGHEVGREPGAVQRRVGRLAPRRRADPGGTPLEWLLLSGARHGLGGAVLRARVDALLDGCALASMASSSVADCPPVLRRALDLAAAVVHEPRVVLLDDPTAGLAGPSRERLWTLIDRLCRDEGRTVLLATADPAEAERLADGAAVLDGGRIVARVNYAPAPARLPARGFPAAGPAAAPVRR